MEIQYVYTKKRSEFGRQCLFSDVPAQIVLDIAPDCTQLQNYILREPCEIATQCVKEMSEHEVNTERAEYAIKGINHVEGGWPKDVNYAEPEQVARFRKKVEKEESYTKDVLILGEILEACIKQNNAIDIYESYFEDAKETVGTDDQSELPSAKTLNVLRDPTKLKRAANHLSWSVDGSKLAVAYSKDSTINKILNFLKSQFCNIFYCSMEFNNNVPQSYDSFVWDIDAPNKFADRLSSQNSSICTLEYNPKDQHVILGGCLNGQLCVWDTRKGSKPVSVSPVEKSHRDPAGSVLWMQTKTGNDCFTCSSDGQVFWWDVKKGMDDPVDSLVIDTGCILKI